MRANRVKRHSSGAKEKRGFQKRRSQERHRQKRRSKKRQQKKEGANSIGSVSGLQ